VSHVLWGNEAWAAHLAQPERDFMEHNILCEAVEESGRVWVHTHGMGKFGLPDLEMDGVPEKEAAVVSKWLLKAAELLVDARTAGGFSPETLLSVPGSQVRFRLEWRPGDPEQHFPFGSIRLHPYLSSDTHERAPKAAEQSFSAAPSSAVRGRKTPSPPLDPIRAGKLRQAMIDAHQCAQFELPAFKKSFLQRKAGAVYAVKVGFKAKGGLLEWMWVALDSWRGKALTGFVENTPVLRKDLRRGSRVQFSETEIFDWVIAKGGSVVKGGFTESVTMTA
jgi:uncharacterized protein YegJ (DUF2314 family)